MEQVAGTVSVLIWRQTCSLPTTETSRANRKRDTEARKVADENYFGSLIKLCHAKFSVFKAHQKLRDEDLEVLKQAISILHNVSKLARRGNFQGQVSGAC